MYNFLRLTDKTTSEDVILNLSNINFVDYDSSLNSYVVYMNNNYKVYFKSKRLQQYLLEALTNA